MYTDDFPTNMFCGVRENTPAIKYNVIGNTLRAQIPDAFGLSPDHLKTAFASLDHIIYKIKIKFYINQSRLTIICFCSDFEWSGP